MLMLRYACCKVRPHRPMYVHKSHPTGNMSSMLKSHARRAHMSKCMPIQLKYTRSLVCYAGVGPFSPDANHLSNDSHKYFFIIILLGHVSTLGA